MQKRGKRSKVVNGIFLIIGILCIAYFLILGFGVRFGQAQSWIWVVMGIAAIVRYLLYRTGRPCLPYWLTRTVGVLFVLWLITLIVGEGVVVKGFFETPKDNLEYVVVLGAKVNGTQPSGALRNRIQKASEYLSENPNTIAVATGGKGDDEGISEAQCIYNGLTERGIAAERILLEEKATDTEENLRYSMEIIENADASVGIVSNNFHISRALRMAKAAGFTNAQGIPVATSWISFPHYMMREYCGLMVEVLKKIL